MKLEIEVEAKPAVKNYYKGLVAEVEKQLAVAEKAKEKGLDLSTGIESKPVADLADRTETIIGPIGIAKRYRQVFEEKKGDRLEAIFQLFREILEFSRSLYETEKKTYHVSAVLGNVPASEDLGDDDLPGLFDQDDARHIRRHVPFECQGGLGGVSHDENQGVRHSARRGDAHVTQAEADPGLSALDGGAIFRPDEVDLHVPRCR